MTKTYQIKNKQDKVLVIRKNYHIKIIHVSHHIQAKVIQN